MNFNLASFLPTNLQAIAIKVGIYAIAALAIFSTGFYSGCSYKQNQWDAEKFHAMERTQKQEKADAKAGERTIGDFKENQGKVTGAGVFIKEELTKTNPPKITKVVCPSVVSSAVVINTDKPEVKENDEKPSAIFTVDAMRLYDVSARPQDSELRTRTYERTEETTVDEGFEKIILPNNLICADNYNQLVALRQRILDKQKSFPDSVD